MKKLTIKQILIPIIVSYLAVSYINNQFNPLLLSYNARSSQVLGIVVCIWFQLIWSDKND